MSHKSTNARAKIEQRIKRVEAYRDDGRPKCQLELLAIERQIDDLLHGHERELIWDEDEAQRGVKFFETLKHWKGKLSGQTFTLPPWQEEGIVAPLLGWYRERSREKGGFRRFTVGGIELPKKNGKSTMAAGLGLFGLVADKEAGTEVYSAATMRDQAAIVFQCAKNMVPKVFLQKQLLKIYVHSIECPALNGSFKALGSDHHSADGINIHFGIVDELHRHKTRDLWDILVAGTVGRRHPLLLWISTAGWDRGSIWYEQHEKCRRILEKPTPETDNVFSYMTGIDEGDDWTDPKIWWKANPNLKIAIDEKNFGEIVLSAKESPQEENKVRRLHFNQITEQDVLWIPMNVWDENGGIEQPDSEKEFLLNRKLWESEMLGEPCYAALDLATTRDICAWTKCFPVDDDRYRFITRYFAPEEAADKRQEHDQRNWQLWAAHKLINTTPGSATDYDTILEFMIEDAKQYNIKQVAIDPHKRGNDVSVNAQVWHVA